MLKDIKNVMSTKRSNSNSSSVSSTIVDVHTGKEYEIPIDKDVSFTFYLLYNNF